MFKYFIRTVANAYPHFVTRLYVHLRFRIINPIILDALLNYFRPDRKTVVLGCGFGLFDLVMGLKWPDKPICGVDINEGRIEMARRTAKTLRLNNNDFEVLDITKSMGDLKSADEMLLLDILHHIPHDAQARILRVCHGLLTEGGYLIIKDIHRGSPFKLFFTWTLDMLMTKGEPVFYRNREDLIQEIENVGFHVICLYLDDILPYPHILYVCRKKPVTHLASE